MDRSSDLAEQISTCSEACDRGLPMLPVVFDEAAEREKFETWFLKEFYEGSEACRNWLHREADTYWYAHPQGLWKAWLAYAKSRAEGK